MRLTQDVKRAERVLMRRSEILPLELERAFQMADGERIDAALTNGVLTLTIAKRAEAKPRKIAIKR